MSMFSRLTDIFQSNFNAMLDKAEDPKKVIRLIIGEMEETLVEVRAVAATHIAEQKQISRKLTQLQKKATWWYEKAELAMQKEQESLARSALQQRQQIQDEIELLEEKAVQVKEGLDKLSDDATALTTRLQQARLKERALYSREQTAKVRRDIQTNTELDSETIIQRFDQFESRIDQVEAQVEAYDMGADSLHQQFEDLQKQDELEQQLNQLKAKVA